ncbi:Nucleotide-sugar transporter [Oesophagostomum dentatum]|uniref:Nucleotide-sugar transporter n=1 Tax=Oesophagostomum dentatum TaxID=61180 RepID=A0A0B1SD44_OESDE|nr:Nucleotide-sugar transporter [Oesophagostomum dentatum]
MEIIKLTLCSIVIYISSDGFTSFAQKIYNYLWINKLESLKVSVPAFAYAIQNNLYYIALGNIDATTYTITYQLRILTTAILSVVMLKKKLSSYQWGALTMSGIGVILVQYVSFYEEGMIRSWDFY